MTQRRESQTGQSEADKVTDLASARSASEIDRIAAAIDKHRQSGTKPSSVHEHDATRQALAARHLLVISRQVETAFKSPLLSNPAWDILLDLFIQRTERKPASIISVCIAANAPTSTALRYMQAMLDSGMIVKRPSADDDRELLVDLSDATYAMMRSILG